MARGGFEPTVRLLLELGADVNSKTRQRCVCFPDADLSRSVSTLL
jgi:hypothetical protein